MHLIYNSDQWNFNGLPYDFLHTAFALANYYIVLQMCKYCQLKCNFFRTWFIQPIMEEWLATLLPQVTEFFSCDNEVCNYNGSFMISCIIYWIQNCTKSTHLLYLVNEG